MSKNKPKTPYPIDAVLAITYQCNSKCSMCNIWKDQTKGTMEPKEYKKLPKTLKYVNISGGEPFMRQDIVEIIEAINERCNGPEIVISTNGFTPELIKRQMERFMKTVPQIGIAFSLDGIGKMHDEIRGVPGGYEKVMKTLQEVKSLGLKNIRFAFTAQDKNIAHFCKVYDLAVKEGIEFTCAVVQSSEHYFKKQNEKLARLDQFKKEFEYVKKNELRSMNKKRWARAYFIDGLYNVLEDQPRKLPSLAMGDFFFLDPLGFVYPSNVISEKMGNIKDESFAKIWNSAKADKMRDKLLTFDDKDWMICTARTAMLKHPVKVSAWAAWNKAKAHVS
ncbi:MAG: radical SAM protein [bacterium]